MRIEQVPDNYPTTTVRKKRTHTKKNTRPHSERHETGGWKLRPIQETITVERIPNACTCTWRPLQYDSGTKMLLKFRNAICPVRREHG